MLIWGTQYTRKCYKPSREIWQKPSWNLVSAIRLLSRSFSGLQATTLALLPGCVYFITIFSFSIFHPNRSTSCIGQKTVRLHLARKKKMEMKLCWIVPRITAEMQYKVLGDLISFLSESEEALQSSLC